MEKIAIKYVAGRPIGKLYYNRERFVFNQKNNFTCEVPLAVWESIKQSNEFIPAVVEINSSENITFSDAKKVDNTDTKNDLTEELTCECGFVAKTVNGLNTHRVKSKKHKGE